MSLTAMRSSLSALVGTDLQFAFDAIKQPPGFLRQSVWQSAAQALHKIIFGDAVFAVHQP